MAKPSYSSLNVMLVRQARPEESIYVQTRSGIGDFAAGMRAFARAIWLEIILIVRTPRSILATDQSLNGGNERLGFTQTTLHVGARHFATAVVGPLA